MSLLGTSSSSPTAMRSSISDVETRIRRRRADIVAAIGNAARSAGARATSPEALIAAGLFGAALEREHQLHGLRVLEIIQKTSADLRPLVAAVSGTHACSD